MREQCLARAGTDRKVAFNEAAISPTRARSARNAGSRLLLSAAVTRRRVPTASK